MSPQDQGNERSIWYYLGAGGGTATDMHNNRALGLWSIAWALAMIAAAALVRGLDLSSVTAWVVALAPNLVALAALRAYLRFLRMTDELQRRIQLESIAVGFGATYLLAVGYVVAEAAGAPPLDLVWLVLFMTMSWMLGSLIAVRRYR